MDCRHPGLIDIVEPGLESHSHADTHRNVQWPTNGFVGHTSRSQKTLVWGAVEVDVDRRCMTGRGILRVIRNAKKKDTETFDSDMHSRRKR